MVYNYAKVDKKRKQNLINSLWKTTHLRHTNLLMV
jgi:hypothetical protein